jgi:poly-gamma-glutamate capsule biosynthesis protein CapA/YwtB (metallophosphatase superfamily)
VTTSAELGAIEPPQQTGVTIFLSGDVMLGRGIDQILPDPCDPQIYEPVVRSAQEYIQLAERVNGPIARPVDFDYVWGAGLEELRRLRPDAYIVNLETAITRNEDYLPKGINYRMSPENADCLSAAGVNCCVLANNHILDWGQSGLLETLATLERMGIKTAGAGQNIERARAPAVLDIGERQRVIVFAFASATSGTPRSWAAQGSTPGVNLLPDLSNEAAIQLGHRLRQIRRSGDIVIVSLHWGPNWGYHIPKEERTFARRLIDKADVSVVFGHSSHHAKAIEIYRDRLILYGCGDFLNDYEGISGYEEYRGDLALLYAASFDSASANLVGLEIAPFRIRRLQLIRASNEDVAWLQQRLGEQSRSFGVNIELTPDARLAVFARK